MPVKKARATGGYDIDIGIGGLKAGGLLQGIEKLVELAERLKAAGGEVKKEGEVDLGHLKKGLKGVYGFSIKTAVGGEPVVETFGNIKKTARGPVVDEERDPLTDVFDEKDDVVVIVEAPGVREEDIALDLNEDILDVSARGGNRRYRKEVLLPCKVRAGNMTYSYKNGILEIRIKK